MRTRWLVAPAGAFCLALGAGSDLFAAETAPLEETHTPTYKDQITVKDSPSLTTPSPEQARAALATVAGGTSFVDAETYEEGRVSTLKDALEMAPGVFVQPRFGAEEARLSIRGSGVRQPGRELRAALVR